MVVDHESQLGFADDRVSTDQTIKSCLVFHSPHECWGRSSALQVITYAKKLSLTSLRGSLFGILDICGSYFEETDFSYALHGCLLRAISFAMAFRTRGAVMVIAGVTESLAVPALSRLYRYHQEQQKYFSA